MTADDASREYGDANPSFTFQAVGFKNSETVADLTTATTCVSAAVDATPVSPPTFAIPCSGGASNNYNFSYSDGTLTITKAYLTVTGQCRAPQINDNI